MKINLSVSKYNELKKYLEKTNKTLDEVLTTYYTSCIDYFKKLDQVKEEKIVKEIIERITQKNERFGVSKIFNEYNLDFSEANDINSYLTLAGYIKPIENKPKPCKTAVIQENIELEYEMPSDIKSKLDPYYTSYNQNYEDDAVEAINSFIVNNRSMAEEDMTKPIEEFIEMIKTNKIKKEDVNISVIQRNCLVGYPRAIQIKNYLKEKGII